MPLSFCSRRTAAIAVMMPSGRLTKKIQCQLTAWVIRPPASKPMAAPAEATKLKMPNAFARSSGSGKRVTIMARITAELTAPPMPWTKRAPISIGCAKEAPQSTDAPVKIARPTMIDALAAEQVAHPAREQQQPAERDQVRVDDPRQPGLREAEIDLDGRQRDVDDRHVDDDQEKTRAEHDQGEPA